MATPNTSLSVHLHVAQVTLDSFQRPPQRGSVFLQDQSSAPRMADVQIQDPIASTRLMGYRKYLCQTCAQPRGSAWLLTAEDCQNMLQERSLESVERNPDNRIDSLIFRLTEAHRELLVRFWICPMM